MSPDDGRRSRAHEPVLDRGGWSAHLELRFARTHRGTRLVHRAHRGPLRVQKALYPEGDDVCQVAIIHPPGGIAGGDALQLDVALERHAHAQLITPGAAKWYRARAEARQILDFAVADEARLEWLPQENIVFDGATMRTSTRISLAGSGAAILWDVVCLGRIAAGETFTHGMMRQRLEVVRDGLPVWLEQNLLPAASSALRSPAGLGGQPVFGTFVLAAPSIDDAWLALARNVGSDLAKQDHAVTRLPGILLARCRSNSTPLVNAWFRALWAALRPEVFGRDARTPRLWQT
ncbi:MAG: urease accessory protein UreD [Pseudomonadota bacterium]|nr:urease accessory protein UreD [Pseudomonadota bacterium]